MGGPLKTSLFVTPADLAPRDEKRVELLELLAKPTRASGLDGFVESFLRGVEVAQDDQRLAGSFFERHRGNGATFTPFVVRPDEAGGRGHFDIPAEEGHRFL